MSGIAVGSSIIVVDCGNSFEVGKILRRDVEAFFHLPVKHLFLTHTHTDHRKGMDAFSDTSLIVSQKCLENMPKSVRMNKWSVQSFDITSTKNAEDISVEFHLTSGHSIGSSIAYIPEEKVLFGGDLFISESANFGLPVMHFYQNKPKRTGNPDEYIAAYKKCRKWDIEIIIPGHGDVIHSAQDYLDNQISFFDELKSFFLSSIDEGVLLEELELPKLEPIEQAYITARTHAQKSQSIRWLDHYLDLLKLSFYNYYSGKSKTHS